MLNTFFISTVRGVAFATLLLACNVTVTHAQSPCPPADSLSTEWVQSLLTEDISRPARNLLGIEHLEGRQLRVLGTHPDDHAVCEALFDQLPPELRALYTTPSSSRIMYYQVGDRYLQYELTGRPLGLGYTISFDLQLVEVGRLAK